MHYLWKLLKIVCGIQSVLQLGQPRNVDVGPLIAPPTVGPSINETIILNQIQTMELSVNEIIILNLIQTVGHSVNPIQQWVYQQRIDHLQLIKTSKPSVKETIYDLQTL